MGRIYRSENNSGRAVDWFEKAVKVNDKNALHHFYLGASLGSEAQKANKLRQPFLAKRVKSEFERSVALDPTLVEGRLGLVDFYSMAPGFMGGSMAKAYEQATEITKLNAMRGHIATAQLLEKEKKLADAERELTAAVAAAPDSNASYNTLASFYRRQKRTADAVGTYERLLRAKPDAVNVHYNIGVTLTLANENLDRAERELKQWLSAPPKDVGQPVVAYAHFSLGSIYEKQGKKDAARGEYQTAIQINPQAEDFKKALAALK
jgi:tetratricopeptide (TPR) repeat protein